MTPTPAPDMAPIELPLWWQDFLQRVCEIPDRNSPEGEPEAMVATAKELENCALNAIEQCIEASRAAVQAPEVAAVENLVFEFEQAVISTAHDLAGPSERKEAADLRTELLNAIRAHAAPPQSAPADAPSSVISWSGFNLHGDAASVQEARRLLDCEARLLGLEAEIKAKQLVRPAAAPGVAEAAPVAELHAAYCHSQQQFLDLQAADHVLAGLVDEMYRLLLSGDVRFVGDLGGGCWTWPDRAKTAIEGATPTSANVARLTDAGIDRWVVVCETVLDVGRGGDVRTGGRPELGYALFANAGTFSTEEEARSAHRSAGLPLGWVVMPLSRLLPDLTGVAIGEKP